MSRAKLPDGRIISVDASDFELDGMTIHGGIRRMTGADLAERGITLIPDAPLPSSPLVNVTEDVESAPGIAIETPRDPNQVRAILIQRAKQCRWDREQRGIEVGGMQVATDDRSKMMIMGARMKADADPQFTTDWDAADGEPPVTINAATIIAISNAVSDHVATCFEIYNAVFAGIKADPPTITTIEQVEAAFA